MYHTGSSQLFKITVYKVQSKGIIYSEGAENI